MAATRGSDDQTTNTNEGRRRFSFFPPGLHAQEDADPEAPAPVTPASAEPNAPAEELPAPATPAEITEHDEEHDVPETFPGSGYTPVVGRIPIFKLRPQIEDELWPTKAVEGDVIPFSCVSFREGHDLIGVELVINTPDGETARHRMHPGAPGTDSWECSCLLYTSDAADE